MPNKDMNNPNAALDPQNDIHALAVVTAQEVGEANAWFDEREQYDDDHMYPDDGDYDSSSDF